MADLSGKKILFIATDGFEYSELTEPRDYLTGEGAEVTLASPKSDPIQGESGGEKQGKVTPDITIDEVDCDDYDALVIPGGVTNPDALRMNARAVEIVAEFAAAEKPIAAICHGPWLLVEADVIDGVQATSWPSLRTDLENAGADVVDREVVVDGNFITSRKPDDIPAFSRAISDALIEADVDA
ncbi:type 1 glutamine amidotransferase [Sphingorhabdus soli]|uniref:Type 1 glutamine amidotransferase n=1 Tax=Flavisphingopyxis soli TaxID=2601267 RepID=A0A5C6U633_9SPHN|nr:type 1 glutamine amidotransferase domain-containing protein [Sphingorhabdus soli]TXC68209.1 type 1 glutamine amidotransferase [Sphingorhabdus soli]